MSATVTVLVGSNEFRATTPDAIKAVPPPLKAPTTTVSMDNAAVCKNVNSLFD